MIRLWIALALIAALAGPAAALDLQLPAAARLTVERNTDPDLYAAPVAAYANGDVPVVTLEGPVRRAAWRLEAQGLTPLQVMQPLRAQLANAGLDIVLDCTADACGGFDFRFAVETLPGPNMYVNIRAFHFVTGLRSQDGIPVEAVTVLASTSATSAYVQIVQAGVAADGTVQVAAVADLPVSKTPVVQGDFAATLLAEGHVVLDALEFETGSAELGAGPFASLSKLATFLNAQTGLRVALVGHTDNVGSLDGNIALSRRRAQSVRQRLIDAHGVAAGRMDAQGMGYLAPLASNLDAAGRDANRRVEVILLGE